MPLRTQTIQASESVEMIVMQYTRMHTPPFIHDFFFFGFWVCEPQLELVLPRKISKEAKVTHALRGVTCGRGGEFSAPRACHPPSATLPHS